MPKESWNHTHRLLSYLVVVISALSMAPSAWASTLSEIKEEGRVRIGFANEAPYAYVAEGDTLTGEAVEIARIVFGKMGVETVDGVLTEFGSLIPGLLSDRFAIIAAGMYITPKRCAVVVFSEPTFCIGEAFLVQADNPKSLHSYEDINDDPHLVLAITAGSVEADYAKAVGIDQRQIAIYPDPVSAATAVAVGRADALAAPTLTVNRLVQNLDGAVSRADPFIGPVVDGQIVGGCGAFAFRKNDTALVEAFNLQLASFLGSSEHLKLVEPFGLTRGELPYTSTAELCAADG